ncbi:MAG: hypothetical protein HYY22_09210 [Thaumarchaeota archaeon]|nr:hypothetical protein [Nitrososphaerota archaeon]
MKTILLNTLQKISNADIRALFGFLSFALYLDIQSTIIALSKPDCPTCHETRPWMNLTPEGALVKTSLVMLFLGVIYILDKHKDTIIYRESNKVITLEKVAKDLRIASVLLGLSIIIFGFLSNMLLYYFNYNIPVPVLINLQP